jgi:hypothetical protein
MFTECSLNVALNVKVGACDMNGVDLSECSLDVDRMLTIC